MVVYSFLEIWFQHIAILNDLWKITVVDIVEIGSGDRVHVRKVEELIEFIQGNPDPRELKRALAVQMVMQNYKHSTIGNILGVSVGFVNKWKYMFVEQGVSGLRLKYKGSKSCLDSKQKRLFGT